MKKHKKLFVTLGVILAITISFIFGSKSDDVYKEDTKTKIVKRGNTLSMMLETEAGSGNYEMTTQSGWPTDGYTFNSTLSKCENGGEVYWDDSSKKVFMSANTSDKCYVYFDKTPTSLADYVKSLYTGTQGENNIYYHNGTIVSKNEFTDDNNTTYPVGTILDANDGSYRYAGAKEAVNNYVCLDSNENTCSKANLFRIIGVFDNKVKVIKATPIGNMAWNSDGLNGWETSSLNTYLNGEYLTSLGDLANKIDTTIWETIGNTGEKIYGVVPAITYQNEVVNSAITDYTFNAKIGLIYLSDFGFAASSSAWSTTLNNYENSAITSVNWIGSKEWTITRMEDDETYAFAFLTIWSGIWGVQVDDSHYVSPSFYLSSSVTYVSGSGSASDPMVIN